MSTTNLEPYEVKIIPTQQFMEEEEERAILCSINRFLRLDESAPVCDAVAEGEAEEDDDDGEDEDISLEQVKSYVQRMSQQLTAYRTVVSVQKRELESAAQSLGDLRAQLEKAEVRYGTEMEACRAAEEQSEYHKAQAVAMAQQLDRAFHSFGALATTLDALRPSEVEVDLSIVEGDVPSKVKVQLGATTIASETEDSGATLVATASEEQETKRGLKMFGKSRALSLLHLDEAALEAAFEPRPAAGGVARVAAVAAAMAANPLDGGLQHASLHALAGLAAEPCNHPALHAVAPSAIAAMKAFHTERGIVQHGIILLARLVAQQADSNLAGIHALETLVAVMRAHPTDAVIQQHVIWVLACAASSSADQEALMTYGGMEAVAGAMALLSNDPLAQKTGSAVLAGLSGTVALRDQSAAQISRAWRVTLVALHDCASDLDVQMYGSHILANLASSLGRDAPAGALAAGLKAMTCAMTGHGAECGLQKLTCQAVSSIAAALPEDVREEEPAWGADVIDAVVTALLGYCEETELQEHGCRALSRLALTGRAMQDLIVDRAGIEIAINALRVSAALPSLAACPPREAVQCTIRCTGLLPRELCGLPVSFPKHSELAPRSNKQSRIPHAGGAGRSAHITARASAGSSVSLVTP
ncbi:hypothetical protein CYMTET_32692 [Cymbomonas tetramitiformis]|uniref:Uncharacterized protein n=1 Tax=Cymbomonas tetramitiformis TaxID=36881 RepID=A0AAE0FEX1_9CHLO|nr:hypothetical protein CYMTET_32692 [Cymbomonas tetramitiformis]